MKIDLIGVTIPWAFLGWSVFVIFLLMILAGMIYLLDLVLRDAERR